MLVGFLTVIGTLLSIMFYLMKQHDTKAADPVIIKQKEQDEINTAIAKGAKGINAINLLLNQYLSRLPDQTSAPK